MVSSVTSVQWGQRTASSAGQYASSLVGAPAGALPDIKALEHAEPHYGSHAVQRSAAGLLEWLQAQYVGQSTLGSLGASASRQLGETFWLNTPCLLCSDSDMCC